MKQAFPYILPLGDTAATIYFGEEISQEINRKVQALYKYIKASNIEGVMDVIPAYASLTLVYDVWVIEKLLLQPKAYNYICEFLWESTFALTFDEASTTSRKINIPVCYDDVFGIDLGLLALQNKIDKEQIIHYHCSQTYNVYMIGFLPGFAYMGTLHTSIATPRKETPRQIVPAGSVGIAGYQTGVYSFDSPGGWNIIGKTPIPLFNAKNSEPSLLQPGDEVQFVPISINEFNYILAS